MYLKRIRARNFRAFGDGTTAPELNWELNPGLNILVGENDAGKTGIVDAIRQVLLSTSYENVRLYEQDFHINTSTRAQSLFIEATLSGLSKEQEGAVLDWLTLEDDDIAMAHGSSPVPTTSCAMAFVCQIIRMRQRL